VVKVGGSLFDLPDLGPRLRRWLEGTSGGVLLVPGGGDAADVVRAFDRRHVLGEERSHWLALCALSLNARFLAALLPGAEVIADIAAWARVAGSASVAVLDAHAFVLADDGRPGALPHRWEVTSDCVAARAAVVAGCRRLTLLKSTDLPADTDWTAAGRLGLVDTHFVRVVGPEKVEVRWVNFRAWGS
jgi:aspartokinase-like uncharacterized kinase